jgi:hypothetical protein
MAQITGRTRGGADLPAVPPEAVSTEAGLHADVAPAVAVDPANGPSHPTSRKPDAPTGGGHGHQ